MTLTRTCAATVLSLILGAAALGATLDAAQGPRIIQRDGESVRAKVQPGDRIIDVKTMAGEPPLWIVQKTPTTTRDVIRFLDAGVDAIVLAEVTETTPRLVDKDSWLETDVRVRPVRRLRYHPSDESQATLESEFSLTYDGGEMRLKDCVIRFGDYPLLREGKRYVLGVVIDPVTGRVGLSFQYAVDGSGRIASESVWSGATTPPSSPLHGMDVVQFERELRR